MLSPRTVDCRLKPQRSCAFSATKLLAYDCRLSFFDSQAAIEYGELRALLQKAGTPIGAMDMLIAAHAKACGKILVTNNEREFERVPSLKIENWV